MSEKIILLGAAGQVGRQLIATRPEDIELHAYTRQELNICSQSELESLFQAVAPSTVINAAAYTDVEAAEENQDLAFAVNSEAPGMIAANCPPDCRFIHLSTDFVFDGEKGEPYRPEDATAPLNVYGASKLQGEINVLNQRPDSLILRTAWIYSPTGKNFLSAMLKLLSEKTELRVVDDQRGTPSSAATLAQVIWRFVNNRDLQGIFHWTDRGEASWYEFACEIQKQALSLDLLDKRIPIIPVSSEEYPTAAKRPANSVLEKGETYQAIRYEGKDWQDELKAVLAGLKA